MKTTDGRDKDILDKQGVETDGKDGEETLKDAPTSSNNKKGRSLRKSGYTIQKICDGKMYSRTRTFKAESHKLNIRVTRWHNKYKMLNCIERHNFSE